MTIMVSGSFKRLLLSMLILLGIGSTVAFSQKNLSGNLNQPKAHVVGIPPSPTDRVIVDDVSGFSVNDTIVLIQMQGVKILLSPYGTLQNKFGEPGMHEFLIIQSVNGGTNEIIFRNELLKNYDVAGSVQIVRVPYYNSARVTGTLFCDPWNPATGKGGVLALIVGRTLELTGNIDVSGRGFIGANDVIGTGICWNTNPTAYGQDYYPSSDPNSGYKGEGVANYTEFDVPLIPNYAKGKGQNWTGGGGGNARFSGGGGGSNRGAGGLGGKEDCFPPSPGGSGGLVADHTSLPDRIYFGGGGGAATSLTGLSPSGGNGGGIVIIVTETIKGSGGKILSNGADGGTAVANGGAGGGGAGGSIALSLSSFGSTPLEFYAKGGNGGNNPGIFGEGGGGGGGLLYVNTALPTGVVTPFLTGGNPGNFPSSTAYAGNIGEVRQGFKAILNGFLFNSIHSSVSGNQSDSVCSNMIPPKINGTKPVGGNGPYFYLWEKSYNKVTWIPLVNDPDPLNYSPTLADAITPTDSVWFRRTITDSSPIVLVDISKPVKFYMQPYIKNNIVGNSDTICFAQNPAAFSSLAALQDGNKIYSFKWMVSTNSTTFSIPTNTSTTEGYTPPPALVNTSWYRRTVNSGMCIDSAAMVKITVLDTIKKNRILNSPPDICFGTSFVNLTATTTSTSPDKLEGGDNLYRFKWESNINGGGWVTAPGVSNGPGYNPGELPQRVPLNEYLYRRVVYSGNHNVCANTSNSVLLKDFPVIANNSITSLTQPVCSGTIPPNLTGSQPVNGNGVVYNYVWQDSTKLHTWANISGATSRDYQPPALTDTTRYRRIVSSSACTDISKSIIVNVHKPIVNNISLLSSGTDTTICNSAIPHLLKGLVATGGTNIPGTYSYQWVNSTDNGTTWNNLSIGGTGVSYQPPALTAVSSPIIYSYRRLVSSGACLNTVSASTINVTVLPTITNNTISVDQTVCYNTIPAALTGVTPGGGNGSYTYFWEQSINNGTTWGPAAGPGINTASSYSPPASAIRTLYRRTVSSGTANCCTSISNIITIDIYPLPTGTITSITPVTICEGSKVPLNITLTGASPWTVVYNENASRVTAPPVTSGISTILASPVTGTALTTYNYSLFSVRDNNGCFATSLTGIRRADVYKIPSANAGPDQVVCGPKVTLTATPSYGTGIWQYPPAVVASTPNGPTVRVTIDSTFAGSNISHKFYWEETNWNCKNKDSVIITFDKRIGSINAGPDTSLYTFDNIYHMIAAPVKISDGQKGIWTIINGTGSFDNPESNTSIVRELSKGTNTFLWTVQNGQCSLGDQVKINVYELEIPEGFSPNNDPGGYNNKFIIKGLDLVNQVAELSVVNSAGAEVFSTSNRSGQRWTDWDGTNSKGLDLPQGTYYYLLKITSNGNNQVFKKSGFIILKRY
jgi:hypothetical protein